MESQKVSVSVAAKMLGIGQEELRYRMQTERNKPVEQQTYPIGICKESRSGKTLRCEVYRPLLQKFLGMTDDEWERGVKNET